MYSANNILVLESNERDDLIRRLFDGGYTPIVREDMQEALDKFRHGNFAGILIDRKNVDIDPLEFILNIREINTRTPVIIIGRSDKEYEDRVLRNRTRVYFIPDKKEQLEEMMRNILEDASNGDAD